MFQRDVPWSILGEIFGKIPEDAPGQLPVRIKENISFGITGKISERSPEKYQEIFYKL